MNAPTFNISERAMLATLNISLWTARKRDKKITAKVAKDHGTIKAVGNYNKRLLPMEAESYEAVRRAGTAAREYHYNSTLPWAQDGARILPAAQYFAYVERMKELQQEFDTAVEAFLADYPRLRENARVLLNGMYDEADYRSVRELEQAFKFKRDVFPMPSADDFRVELGDNEVSAVREAIQRSVHQATADAMRDLAQRVHDAVAHIAERLSGADNIFRDSLIGNLKDIVELLPKLNLTNDATLEATRKRLAGYLCTLEPAKLREDSKEREAAAAEADAIMKQMAAFMQ